MIGTLIGFDLADDEKTVELIFKVKYPCEERIALGQYAEITLGKTERSNHVQENEA